MTTIRHGWKDAGARSAPPAASNLAQLTADAAAISVQRCLPIAGDRALAAERRPGARTQLGMPAWAQPPSEPPPSSAERSRTPSCAPDSALAPARRGPPPLPARFAAPKVMVAGSSRLLPDTVPAARRLQLHDTIGELDPDDDLLVPAPTPLPVRPSAPRARDQTLVMRRSASAPVGLRGLLVRTLLRLLALLAPSLRLPPLPDEGARRRTRRRS